MNEVLLLVLSPAATVIGLLLAHKLEMRKLALKEKMIKDKTTADKKEEEEEAAFFPADFASKIEGARREAIVTGDKQVQTLLEVLEVMRIQVRDNAVESKRNGDRIREFEKELFTSRIENIELRKENGILKQKVSDQESQIKNQEVKIGEQDAKIKSLVERIGQLENPPRS